jgi:hypothetical protein
MPVTQLITTVGRSAGGGGGGPTSYLNWTVEMWIKHGSQSDTYPRVFDVGYWPVESLGYSAEGGGEYFWTGNGYDVFSSGSTRDGNWHHIAWTSDGTYLRWFVDGSLSSTVSRTRYVSSTTDTLSLGSSNTNANGWVGKITDFHIASTCKYTGNFSVPTQPILPDSGTTRLLIRAAAESNRFDDFGPSTLATSSIWGTVSFDSDSPYSNNGQIVQYSNIAGSGVIDFGGGYYNTDILTYVKTGWFVSSGSESGYVIGTPFEIVTGVIRVPVTWTPTAGQTWTFYPPGSLSFNGASNVQWPAGSQWALDV